MMKKNRKGIFWFSAAVPSALILAALCGLPAAAQTAAQPQVLTNAVVNEPIHFDVSPPLAELVMEAPAQQGVRLMHAPMRPKPQQLTGARQSQGAEAAGALQPLIAPPSVPLSA
jgi:hypothetical protein